MPALREHRCVCFESTLLWFLAIGDSPLLISASLINLDLLKHFVSELLSRSIVESSILMLII